MKLFPSTKVFLEIGPLAIHWYAVFIMIGALLCYYLCLRNIKKMGYEKDLPEDMFLNVFLFGFLGGRIWYCIFYDLSYYLSNPIEIIQIWDGGLAIQGGIVAGALVVLRYSKKYKLNFLRWADAIIPNVLVAQAIGRWGNFMNQEAFGGVVEESFYNNFPSFIKEMMFINGEYHLPTFLMESVGNLIGFFIIIFIYKKYIKLKRGDLTYAYFMWYGVVRFFVEGFRTDSLMLGSIRMAQLTSIVFIIIGVLGTLGVYDKLMKYNKPVILFDLDGTLLNTDSAIIETYRQLFVKYDEEENFTKDKQIEVLGPALKDQFPIYFPNNDVNELIEEYVLINHDLHKTHVTLLPNVLETIKELYDKGYTLGIISSKQVKGIELGLDQFNMKQYFSVILGVDSVEKAKPNKEAIIKANKQLNKGLDNTIYVGDTNHDIMCGKNAGAFTIGYVNHVERKQNIIDAKPNRIIEDIKEIIDILDNTKYYTYNER